MENKVNPNFRYPLELLQEAQKEFQKLAETTSKSETFWRDQHTELAQEVLRAAGLSDDFKTAGTVQAFETIKKQRETLVHALQKLLAYNQCIAEGKINYRPADHIQVVVEALKSL